MQKIEIGSFEWLEARRSKITATDAPIIMGVSPYCSPFELYHKKVENLEQLVTPAMRRGVDLEPIARDIFEETMGIFVMPRFQLHKDPESFMAASFDGINDDGIVLEIKCPSKKEHELALTHIVTEKYRPQLMHQMCVAGVEEMYFMSYSPDHKTPFVIFKFYQDPIALEKLIEEEKKFYDLLKNRTPPTPDKRDLT